jgi:hypothetical protein
VIDGAGFYDVLHKSVVSRLPMRLEGYYVTQPRNLDIGGAITYTDRNSIFSFPGGRALVPGDVFEGHRIQRGISMSTGSFATAFVAVSEGKTGLYYSESWPVPFGELVLQEGDLVGNKAISDIGPEIKLTKHGRLVFSAALDGKQSILMVPEPTTMALAFMASAFFTMSACRRSRLSSPA